MFTDIFRACMRFVYQVSERDAGLDTFSDVLNNSGNVQTLTYRRVRVTIADVQQQNVLYILSVGL